MYERQIPAIAGWKTFCEANSQLGLLGSRNSWVWFNRNYGRKCAEAGVLRKSISRHWLMDRENFAKVAFEVLSNGETSWAIEEPPC